MSEWPQFNRRPIAEESTEGSVVLMNGTNRGRGSATESLREGISGTNPMCAIAAFANDLTGM